MFKAHNRAFIIHTSVGCEGGEEGENPFSFQKPQKYFIQILPNYEASSIIQHNLQ